MLCALSVGLASGVGLYALTIFSTVFMVAALWVIESFEPDSHKPFMLKIKSEKDTDAHARSSSGSCGPTSCRSSCGAPPTKRSATSSRCRWRCRPTTCPNRILQLDPEGHLAVEWEEKKDKK